MTTVPFVFDDRTFTVQAPDSVQVHIDRLSAQDGIAVYEIICRYAVPTPVKDVRIHWNAPMLEILSVWAPMMLRAREVHQWWAPTRSDSSVGRRSRLSMQSYSIA